MSTPTTFIKIDRNLLSWGWYTVPTTLSVWIFILISANISDRTFQGTEVKRGELITSYNSIAHACGITSDKARTAIKHLVKTNEIEYKGTNRFLHIKVLNYNKYQNVNQKTMTDESHADPMQNTISRVASVPQMKIMLSETASLWLALPVPVVEFSTQKVDSAAREYSV